MYTCVCVHTQMCTSIYVFVCMYVYIYIYIFIYKLKREQPGRLVVYIDS